MASMFVAQWVMKTRSRGAGTERLIRHVAVGLGAYRVSGRCGGDELMLASKAIAGLRSPRLPRALQKIDDGDEQVEDDRCGADPNRRKRDSRPILSGTSSCVRPRTIPACGEDDG